MYCIESASPGEAKKTWDCGDKSIFASKREKKLSLIVKFRSYMGMTETGRTSTKVDGLLLGE